MNDWYVKNIGDAMFAADELERIKSTFQAIYDGADISIEASSGPAVYFRHESEGRLHCEVCVYFSPGAQDLAATFDAEPCRKPLAIGFELLIRLEK